MKLIENTNGNCHIILKIYFNFITLYGNLHKKLLKITKTKQNNNNKKTEEKWRDECE
jgi:hypothetical protein